MANDSSDLTKTSNKAIAIGLFGPAVIWFLHLFFIALIAEWGGFSGMSSRRFLNISLVTWLVTLTSLLAIVATVLAIRQLSETCKCTQATVNNINQHDSHKTFLGSVAIYSGVLFLVIICVQTLPILIFWGWA